MKKIIMILSIACTMFASCSKDSDERVAVSRVDINKTTTVIPLGGTERLTVKIYPEAAAETRYVRWFSDDTSVATIDETGLVHALAVGMTVIRISDEDGKSYPATCAVSVHEQTVAVTGVSLAKPEVTVSVNGSEQLNYTVVPLNATNKNVTWSSNNTDVVTVDNNGKVIGIAAGKATVTVTAEDGGGKFSSSCVVTVQYVDGAIHATGVTLDKPTLSITAGSTGQLTASVEPSNATNQNVIWSSSDENVATVDATGLVTGVAAGTVGITATTVDGGFNRSCIVTVLATTIPVTGVMLNKSTSTITVNSSVELIATVSPPDATDKTVTWSSNATGIATVDAAGKVTGVAAGTATITATAGEFAESCVVTVQSAAISVTGVTLDQALLALQVGDVGTLNATVAPSEATDKSVSWTSSVPAVATVVDGVVTALAAGTTVITVKTVDGDFTQTCTVTVTAGGVTSTGWSAPSTNSYEYSMTYVAQVAFGGELSTDTNVEVAAFVGTETAPRGHAKLIYEPQLSNGVYLVYLTIFSNTSGGETVTLKAYNPSQQSIYNNCKTFTFQGDTSLGSTSEILNCFP